MSASDTYSSYIFTSFEEKCGDFKKFYQCTKITERESFSVHKTDHIVFLHYLSVILASNQYQFLSRTHVIYIAEKYFP